MARSQTNLSRIRLIAVIFLVVALVVTGCQSGAPAANSKAADTSKTSSEKAAAPEKASAPEKKSEPAAAQKPAEKASASSGAVPTSLPKSTEEYLAQIKRDATLLKGLDDELKVPQEWVDAAKKEGKLSILHTIDPPQAKVLLKPFQERYPFIQIDYNRGADEEKVKAIVAAQSGRGNVDMVIGVGGHYFMMAENDLNLNLKDLPAWNNVPDGFKEPGGGWIGIHIRHWSMAYNTNKVKKEDLPKTWEDILTNPRWRNGSLALANRSQLWMLPLWRAKGEQWSRDYVNKLFTEVKPQVRKESLNALLDLLGAGEFDAVIPAAEYRTYQNVLEKAPVSWWTPEPIPLASSELTIMKKSPNVNSARLFANWLLSKEGQVAQYVSDFAPPVHKDMHDPALLPFAEIIEGKKTALREPEDEETVQPVLLKLWEGLWLKSGGSAR